MKALNLAVLAVFFLVVPAAHANSITGSVGFATPLLSTADASPTGDINTSHLFVLENLITTGNENGIFTGMPIQSFGTVAFNTHVNTSLVISDTAFGSFKSTNIMTVTSFSGFLNLLLAGLWTPGTFNTGVTGPIPADFRISFTQSPASTGEISFSGTMGVQSVVPEPSTVWLFLSGMGLLVGGTRLRRLFGA